jgi:hypothetical protein
MGIRRPRLQEPSFNIFLLCVTAERDPFVRDVVENLERRGYSVLLPELGWMDSGQRAATVDQAVSRTWLSAAIVDPTFLSTAWVPSELEALEQVEVRVRRGITSSALPTMDAPAPMAFDAFEGASFIASKLARACGQPRGSAVPPSATVRLCWRCGTSDLNRGSATLRSRQCAGCADQAWRDRESLFDPDPLGMGMLHSFACARCKNPFESPVRFRNRDVKQHDGGALEIAGVACPCGGKVFDSIWTGGSMYEDEY